MGKTNNKVIGGDFERKICRQLSVWWSGDPNSDRLFWRSATSGGLATQRAKTGEVTTRAHCGDLYATDHRGAMLTNLITWETKYGSKDADLHKVLDRPDDAALQEYEQWIIQATDSSFNAKTPYWAIVHHRRQHEDVMTMPLMLWKRLGCSNSTVGGPIMHLSIPMRWKPLPLSPCYCPTRLDDLEVVAVQFELFLQGVTPTEIRNLVRAG